MIDKKSHGSGRLGQNLDRNAARGIKGSATAADGRTHIRGFACPKDNMYLTADRRMWCPLVDYDLKKVGKLLDTAFGTRR
jgi:hypothetical protein